ncbi:hypothetical protein RP20_CCG002445 [Aedes albopictus]|nr:hypothetical protein RP20_CCG002445 [Aedes albopictus]
MIRLFLYGDVPATLDVLVPIVFGVLIPGVEEQHHNGILPAAAAATIFPIVSTLLQLCAPTTNSAAPMLETCHAQTIFFNHGFLRNNE